MKRVLLIITLLCAFNMITLAQIQVTQSGYVGIGTSSPTASLQISRSYYNFTFKPKNPGLEIGGYDGSANSTITFWHSNAGYNELLAKKYSKTSDSTLKTNIQPIKNSVEVLSKINGYSYFYSEDKTKKGEKEYGVLAQEIEKILPELVDSVKGIKVVDYDQLIPFLICAVKEQQAQIETLQKELSALSQSKEHDDGTNKISHSDMSDNQYDIKLKIQQNAPNPFNEVTTIQCFISECIHSAQLKVYDMRGNMVKTIPITDRGNVKIQIQASSLSAGIYAYLLIGDGQTSETKQMVLTK